MPLSLFNSITGFLEESVDQIKKELDISSENSWDNFWQHFDSSQTDNKCIQLLYTMTVVDLVRGVFNELFYIIGGNHYEANEEAHHKVLAKTISIMLDITPESVSEMLDGDLVNDLKINPKDFTLYDGIEGLMDHHRLVRSQRFETGGAALRILSHLPGTSFIFNRIIISQSEVYNRSLQTTTTLF